MNEPLQVLRKLLLLTNALVFLGFGILTTVNIASSSAFYALQMIAIGGHDEFRAVFMGFWLGLTVLFLQAIRHYPLAVVGDLAFMLILFQSLGRLYSFGVDGIPPTRFVLFFVLEFSSAVVGLLIRPHAAPMAWVDPESRRPSCWWWQLGRPA